MTPLLERIDNIDTNLHISAEWAKRKYAEFNSTFFGNSLPKAIQFDMSNTTNAVGDAYCLVSSQPTGESDEIKVGDTFVHGFRIRLSSYFNNITESEAEEVLLHEMIHIWQYATIPKSLLGINMHGHEFAGKTTEINKLSSWKYNLSATNDSSNKARHDDNLMQSKKQYDELKDERLLFMKDKNDAGKTDVIKFKNDADLKEFTDEFAPEHELEITGKASPHELDLFRYRFGALKPNTEENRNGYYIMNPKDIDEAKRLGAIQ